MSLDEKSKRPKIFSTLDWVSPRQFSLTSTIPQLRLRRLSLSLPGCSQSCWVTAPHHFYLFKSTNSFSIIFEGTQRQERSNGSGVSPFPHIRQELWLAPGRNMYFLSPNFFRQAEAAYLVAPCKNQLLPVKSSNWTFCLFNCMLNDKRLKSSVLKAYISLISEKTVFIYVGSLKHSPLTELHTVSGRLLWFFM